MKKGLVYLFTGDGKGKTSAAIGVGVRAAMADKNVAMVCWYKSHDWDVSEYKIPEKIKNFKIYIVGKGFYIKDSRFEFGERDLKISPLTGGGSVVDRVSEEEHRKSAKDSLAIAREILKLSGRRATTEKAIKLSDGAVVKISPVEVLILDEVCNAIEDGLVDVDELVKLILKRGKVHLILTGRKAAGKIIKIADLVTEMKKIKHPYDRGIKAVKGLDY